MVIRLAPALCLDMDGTVRITKSGSDFPKHNKDWQLMPGIENILRKYYGMGYALIVISNQGGVASGFKTMKDIEEEVNYTLSLFGTSHPFTCIKMCPFFEGGSVEPYKHRSLMRKPDIGMLVDCERECYEHGLLIDWDRSLFVGDRNEDELCAKNAGLKFYHINDFLKMPHEFTIPAAAYWETLKPADRVDTDKGTGRVHGLDVPGGLRLAPESTLWDFGNGCGMSVVLDAANAKRLNVRPINK